MSAADAAPWTSAGVTMGGRTFGDGQASDDITHTFTRPMPDGSRLVVAMIYAAVDCCVMFHNADEAEPCECCGEEGIPYRYGWETKTEGWREDADGERIGDEVALLDEQTGSYISWATPAEALRQAKREAARDEARTARSINWNGGPV